MKIVIVNKLLTLTSLDHQHHLPRFVVFVSIFNLILILHFTWALLSADNVDCLFFIYEVNSNLHQNIRYLQTVERFLLCLCIFVTS